MGRLIEKVLERSVGGGGSETGDQLGGRIHSVDYL